MRVLGRFIVTFLVFEGLLAIGGGLLWRLALLDLFWAVMAVLLLINLCVYFIAWLIVEGLIESLIKRERKNAKRRKK